MNKNTFSAFFVAAILFSACNNQNKQDALQSTPSQYPEPLQKIFEHHGGIKNWQKMKAISYEIVGENGNEKQFIDLNNRRERIEGINFKTGFDGANYWLLADTSYQGDPIFYHNLMFYFYAMPFVIADDGINYIPADTLVFDEKAFPGIKISYKNDVGNSPEDEYVLYYNPENFEMTWLSYTVTYFSKEKSKDLYWIKYGDWEKTNGLLLAKSLLRHQNKDGGPDEIIGLKKIENLSISTTAFEDSIFAAPENAEIVNQ